MFRMVESSSDVDKLNLELWYRYLTLASHSSIISHVASR
jgi:hypothetical protein